MLTTVNNSANMEGNESALMVESTDIDSGAPLSEDFRAIITRNKMTPSLANDFSKLDYQSKPAFQRQKLYGELRLGGNYRSHSSSLINKKN